MRESLTISTYSIIHYSSSTKKGRVMSDCFSGFLASSQIIWSQPLYNFSMLVHPAKQGSAVTVTTSCAANISLTVSRSLPVSLSHYRQILIQSTSAAALNSATATLSLNRHMQIHYCQWFLFLILIFFYL